jgi:uncharacterized membrane protein YeaQ/YmgE (transglycosylase-associated protein family)
MQTLFLLAGPAMSELIIMVIIFAVPGLIIGVIGKGFVSSARSFIATGLVGSLGSIVVGLIFLFTRVFQESSFWPVLLLPGLGAIAALFMYNLLTREAA